MGGGGKWGGGGRGGGGGGRREKEGCVSRLTCTVKGNGISFHQTHRMAKRHGDPQWRKNWNTQFQCVQQAHCRHAARNVDAVSVGATSTL